MLPDDRSRNTLYLTNRFHVAVRCLLGLPKKHPSLVPGVPCVDAETEDESACVIMCSPFVNIIIYTTLCFVKTVLRKLMPYMLTH